MHRSRGGIRPGENSMFRIIASIYEGVNDYVRRNYMIRDSMVPMPSSVVRVGSGVVQVVDGASPSWRCRWSCVGSVKVQWLFVGG